MKVGIITFHSVDNHGALLQAYALQSFLEEQGHEAVIIDYRPRFLERRKVLSQRRSWRTALWRVRQRPLQVRFEQFRDCYLKRTHPYYSLEELRRDPPKCDAYITGSDQVWSPIVDGRNEVDLAYFLDFGDAATKRIAYAPSFGVTLEHIPDHHKAKIRAGLSHVETISVREQSGVEIVRALTGKEAAWCLDPVFLLPDEARSRIISSLRRRRPYVFLYMPPASRSGRTAIAAFARRAALRLEHAHSRVGELLNTLRISRPLSPATWFTQLSHAELVITSSFHGVACSIVQCRPFVYVLPSGKNRPMTERVTSLLIRSGLAERCVTEEGLTADVVEDKYRAAIAWAVVWRMITAWRIECQNYLLECLRS